MLNNKHLIMIVTLLVLLVAAPLVAADSGSASFVVTAPLYVAGSQINPGQYNVKWESHSPEATVTFTGVEKPVVIKVPGKVEQVDSKASYNSIITGKDAAGHESIKQLLFSGKNVRIIFE
jgi:hypothetical protein